MLPPENQTLCLHCNAPLTPKDIADGWCDSCGKRVPLSVKGPKNKTAPVAPVDADIPDSHHRTPRWIWAVTTLVLVVVVTILVFGRHG